jgi:glycosyltransferase involved in cell wall biosynthesis
MTKKILIVNDGFPPQVWGGASTIAEAHAKGLAERGWEVHTYVPTSMGLFIEELQSFKPDVVHFHNIHRGWHYPLISLAKKSGAKTFLTAHDVMSFAYEKIDVPRKIGWIENFLSAKRRFRPFGNVLTRLYLRKLDTIIAVSNSLKQALELNGIHNVVVIHNGIAVENFRKLDDGNTLRRNLGLEGAPVVLFVGRFTPPKGSEVLLQAMQEVVRAVPNACLLVVGTVADNWLTTTINKFNLAGSVRFVPAASYEEMPAYYASADVVAVPSIYLDPFPTVNLEAMACHKPVVATCFGGSPEAVEDGITGYVVNPKNTDELAEKIVTLLTDKETAHRFAEAGYERVAQNFSLEKFIVSYEALY